MSVKRCPKCGKKLSETARYCSECGYFIKRKNYNNSGDNIEIDEELYRIDDISSERKKEYKSNRNNILEQEEIKEEKDILNEENGKEKEYEISNRKNIKKEKEYTSNEQKNILNNDNYSDSKVKNINKGNKDVLKKILLTLAIIIVTFVIFDNFLNNNVNLLKMNSKMSYKKIVRKFENASEYSESTEGLESDYNEGSNTFLDEIFDLDETKIDFYNTKFKVNKEEFNSEHVSLDVGRLLGKTVLIGIRIDDDGIIGESIINAMDEKFEPYMDEMIAYLISAADPYITQYINAWESPSDYILVMKEYDKVSILIFEKKLYNQENKSF